VLVSVLGYEDRCIYAAREYAPTASKKLAIAFRDRMMFAYSAHKAWYEANNFSLLDYDRDTFERAFIAFFRKAAAELERSHLNVAIDISSMSRPMLAQIIFALVCLELPPTTVEFLYCPAKFSAPPESPLPLERSEPVTPEYAGWSVRPDLPTSAVIGLGYEYGRALGALEFLEPSVTWAFVPHGEDRRYDRACEIANADFWNLIPKERIHEYRVDNPFDTFVHIESLIYGLKANTRPTIMPFGPKLFALVSLLVAETHRPDVVVWRVSGEQAEPPANRVANGKFVRLPVRFETRR
jgi:hypothetical protein